MEPPTSARVAYVRDAYSCTGTRVGRGGTYKCIVGRFETREIRRFEHLKEPTRDPPTHRGIKRCICAREPIRREHDAGEAQQNRTRQENPLHSVCVEDTHEADGGDVCGGQLLFPGAAAATQQRRIESSWGTLPLLACTSQCFAHVRFNRGMQRVRRNLGFVLGDNPAAAGCIFVCVAVTEREREITEVCAGSLGFVLVRQVWQVAHVEDVGGEEDCTKGVGICVSHWARVQVT
jgi:hypothetical protein